jgi:transposase
LHLIVDGQGTPLAAVLSPGQQHESTCLEPVLAAVRLRRPGCRGGRPRTRPRRLAGDKGYSYARIRRYLRRRGIQAVIPTRKDQRKNPRFDKATYRQRNVVERCVGWLKENRRLATRFEKLAVNFLAMVKLAMIRRCLRLLDSPDRT